jgi:hypothetical protein
MAVAAPKRRSEAQAAPAPARTTPPEPKRRPRDRPRPGGSGRSGGAAAPATAPKRKAPAKRRKASGTSAASAAPARKAAPRRKASSASAAPARKTAPKRRAPGRVIPIAAGTVGRTAVAVTQLPESGLIHRLTRGRAWIGVLGVLLIGIVALNVVTLSFAASAGKIEERNLELSRENTVLNSLNSKKYGQARLHNEAKHQGLAPNTTVEPTALTVTPDAVDRAAARLGAAATAAGIGVAAGEETTGATGEGASGEAAATGEGATGEESPSGEEVTYGEAGLTAEEAAEINLEGLSQEELNAIYEETLAREAAEAGA